MSRFGLVKWLMVGVVAVMLTACGGDDGASAQDIAVSTFRAYAQDPATADAPDAEDYDALGVDLHGHSITEINAYIAQLGDPDAVDTKAELDAIAAALGVTILDTDGDGTYDAFDTDDDGDGVADGSDAFPLDASESVDTDGDGIGNNADTDDDGDGVADGSDAFPLDAHESVDTDGDGVGNNADTDDDGDGISDADEDAAGSDRLDPDSLAWGGKVYQVVTSPHTGYKWLDRNLGASQVCTTYDDANCYGDYYQWGRSADGHEDKNSDITSIQATSLTPGHSKFIKDNTDWVDASSDDDVLRAVYWSKSDGSSVCPVGFRVPTLNELRAETLDNGVSDSDTAFSNFLKLPSAGLRVSDTVSYESSKGFVWTSSAVHDVSARSIFFKDASSSQVSIYRRSGVSVRCMKPIVTTDAPPVITINGRTPVSIIQFSSYVDAGATATDDVDGAVMVSVAGTVDTDTVGSYTITYTAIDSAGNSATATRTVNVTNTFMFKGKEYGVVKSPYGTGKVWLDRNLGASQVCTALDDADCYGDYYQWGRNADGHEDSGSATTATQATDVNNAGNSFITSDNANDKDWAKAADGDGSSRSDNWSKTDGSSVCPTGFRVPNIDEFNAELFDAGSAVIQNREDAFNSFLKLPSAGNRNYSSGSPSGQGSEGGVWSISVSGSDSLVTDFAGGGAAAIDYGRSYGFSVRCVRD